MLKESFTEARAQIKSLQDGEEYCGAYSDGDFSVHRHTVFTVTLVESTNQPDKPYIRKQDFISADEAVGAIGML